MLKKMMNSNCQRQIKKIRLLPIIANYYKIKKKPLIQKLKINFTKIFICNNNNRHNQKKLKFKRNLNFNYQILYSLKKVSTQFKKIVKKIKNQFQ